jgi:hypothetical protein
MRILTDTVRRLKANWTSELEAEAIAEACRDSGMTWNNSLLNPVVTIQVFFLQVVHGNTACEHLSSLARLPFTAAAYCTARMRLRLQALQLLLARSVGACKPSLVDDALWLGKRVFFVDGSSFSMSDTPSLQTHFGQPGRQRSGCGFPVAHWLAMMHAGSGMIIKMLAGPLRTHEQSGTAELHPELAAGDVLVADRGFCSFVHFALLYQRGIDGLMRIHQRVIVDFRPHRPHVHPARGKSSRKNGLPRSRWLKSLGVTDQLVEWLKPTTCPAWMPAEQFAGLPESLTIRELRYDVHRKGFRTKRVTLATTLLDAELYAKDELAELYRRRWEIETNFGHLKTTMKLDVLKCKTPAGVLKELCVFALIYNLVREVMLAAGRKQDVDPHRISFIAALRWLQDARPIDPLWRLTVVPRRPGRVEPRVRKRRPKNYRLMTKPRAQLKQDLFRH